MALSSVVAVVLPGVAPFELGVVCEVFGLDRTEMGVPAIDFRLAGPTPGVVATSLGFGLEVPHDLTVAADADLIAIPAFPRRDPVPAAVIEVLAAALDRGARVMSVCSGAFVLGAAGLLDGRRCTTHWMYTDELAARFPAAKVDPMVLYVEDGPVLTSAGTASGLDLGLHILRQEFGSQTAAIVARRMVVAPHRDGGQAQYINDPLPTDCHTFAPLLDWITEHLGEPLTVPELADRAAMSPRTFARRFVAETGTTPHRWITGQRVAAAAGLLETTPFGIDEIATRTGFGDAATMRHHFKTIRGTTPQAYRSAFRC